MDGGGIVTSRRDGVRLEGHGWDGKAREMKIQGRVVGMEDSGRKKRLRPGHRAKKSKKHVENC